MSDVNAYQFKEVYEDLGISLSKLGVVMIDIDSGDLASRIREIVSPEDLYTSDEPTDHFTGVLGGEPHVTLVYGLLRTGTEMQKHIKRVLEDGSAVPKAIAIEEVGYFESRKPDEHYYCIVAHLKVTPELAECNERLKFLPHLNTFPGYEPHMTLCYIRKDEELRDSVVSYLSAILKGSTFPTGELNLGDE
jgi:2'-5' RNA ligase